MTGCDGLLKLNEKTWSSGETQTNGSCEYTLVGAALRAERNSQHGGVTMQVRNISPNLVRSCSYIVTLYSGVGQELDDGLDVNTSMSPGGKDLRCTLETVSRAVDVQGANLKVTLTGDDGGRPTFVVPHVQASDFAAYSKALACPGETSMPLF